MSVKLLPNKKFLFSPLGVGGVFSFLFSLLTSSSSYSQSDVLKYARAVVDILASPSMHGRGYVMKGDSIAADYIKKEYEKFGVKPVGKEFYQRFSFPINTFPSELEFGLYLRNDPDKKNYIFCLDGIPGKDYLIDP